MMERAKNILLISICFLYPFLVAGQKQKDAYPFSADNVLQKDIYGTWMVVNYTHSQLIPGATKEAWRKFRKKTISLNPNLATLFKDSCKSPTYKVSRQNTWYYFYNGYREHSTMGIMDDTVTLVELGCKEEPIYENKNTTPFNSDFIITSTPGLIWFNGGLFLKLIRVK